jgi:death-on-curing protein
VDKAAVLIVRLAKNHALPDGNKCAAWVPLRMFIEINGWEWPDYPSGDDAKAAVLAITACEWTESEAPDWLRLRIGAPSD